MPTDPTFIIECEKPETWATTHHPRSQFAYGSYEAALKMVRSKLALSASVPLREKHIWSIRRYGSNSGDYLFRTAG